MRIKIVILFIFFNTYLINCFAQSGFSNAGFAAGYCHSEIPFSSDATTSIPGGYAKGGFVVNTHIDYDFYKYFALTARLMVQSHNVREEILDKFLLNLQDVEYGTWNINGALLGLKIKYPFKNNSFVIYAKSSIGYMHVSSPLINIALTNSFIFGQAPESKMSIAYEYGGGFSLKINKRINVFSELVYLNTKWETNRVNTFTSGTGIYAMPYSGNYTQKINTLNITAGLSFLLLNNE